MLNMFIFWLLEALQFAENQLWKHEEILNAWDGLILQGAELNSSSCSTPMFVALTDSEAYFPDYSWDFHPGTRIGTITIVKHPR